LVDLSHTLNSK